MTKTKSLFWHQGLFLQPQHLQLADMSQQQQSYALTKLGQPYFWGLVNLNVNEAALERDEFEVETCELLLPDGTLVNFPQDAALSSRNFASAWTDRENTFNVYVGIKKLNPRGNNVTMLNNGDSAANVGTRYITNAEPEEAIDLHQNGPVAQVQSLTSVLRLFWESEKEDAHDYDLVPVARIQKSEEADVRTELSPTYIPPCVHVASSAVLTRLIKGLRDELSSRVHQLEEYKTTVDAVGAEMDTRTIPYRLALQLLSSFGPQFFHLAETPNIHPWQVYGFLRQLVGGASTLTNNVSFLGETDDGRVLVPSYNHYDLAGCFQKVSELIVNLLNEITIGGESVAPMEKNEEGLFVATLPDDFFSSNNAFYLALRTETSFNDLLDGFMSLVKISSIGDAEILVEKSLPSLAVRHLKIHPEGLPRRPNTTFFRLERADVAWDGIEREKSIALRWDGAPADLKIEVMVLGR